MSTSPSLASFVPVPPDSHFPIQNLPFGVFRPSPTASARVGVAIGDHVLDLSVVADAGLLRSCDDLLRPARCRGSCDGERNGGVGSDRPLDLSAVVGNVGDDGDAPATCFHRSSLNAFMALGRPAWRATRAAVQRILSADEPCLRDNADLRRQALCRQSSVQMLVPCTIGDYTDCYASRHHATRVGALFRGKGLELPAQWLHMPIAYHGRASSVVVSGTRVVRPSGQLAPPPPSSTGDASPPAPAFGPSQQLDFELEMAFLVGPGNDLGQPIAVEDAMDHVFGLVLCNDWSARDIQRWEYVPLGPFLGKSFATSVSPWVVTLEALEPFRCAAEVQVPPPLPYLTESTRSTFDIQLQVFISPSPSNNPSPPIVTPEELEELQQQQQEAQQPSSVSVSPSAPAVPASPALVPQAPRYVACHSNFKHLYWTIAQEVAHHTVNGCNLRTGDMIASGTTSGPVSGSEACLLESTKGGKEPLKMYLDAVSMQQQQRSLIEALPTIERRYLEDGDEVIMSATCKSQGSVTIGFGECAGVLIPFDFSVNLRRMKEDIPLPVPPIDLLAPTLGVENLEEEVSKEWGDE